MRALYRRAEAYYSKGSTADLELCVTDLQSALKLEPGNTQVRAGGQGGGGGVDLQSALKLEPGNTRVGAGLWGRVDQSNYDVPVMFLEGTCSPLDAHLLVMLLYYSITLLLYYSITQLLYYSITLMILQVRAALAKRQAELREQDRWGGGAGGRPEGWPPAH